MMIETYVLLALFAVLVSIFAVIFLWARDDFYGEQAMPYKRHRKTLESKQ